MNEDLSQWLRANNLAEFESILVENEVDLQTLKLLSDSDLKELGLAFGPRKRFLNAIAALKGTNQTWKSETKAPITPAPRGEHRHLTVMFCDLVGSTTLSERLDSEELHLLFKEYYKVCTEEVLRFEGYVHNLMGDGLLIYFGWPIAHEDSRQAGGAGGSQNGGGCQTDTRCRDPRRPYRSRHRVGHRRRSVAGRKNGAGTRGR